jgi:hypothetical protein
MGKENSSSFKQVPGLLQRGDNYKKNIKMGWGPFKKFLFKNYWPTKAEIYMKAF